MFADLPEWVAEDLRAAVAETLRKRAERAQVRADMARRRAYGLQQRQAAKLARKEQGEG